MPLYRMRNVIGARGIKAFLNLDAGLTRGAVPDPERQLKEAQNRIRNQQKQIESLQERLKKQASTGKPARQTPQKGRKGRSRRNGQEKLLGVRGDIASRYLSGEGIEIGALHRPLELPPVRRSDTWTG